MSVTCNATTLTSQEITKYGTLDPDVGTHLREFYQQN
jgi:hypothetical protein